jgi:hypothetical protein
VNDFGSLLPAGSPSNIRHCTPGYYPIKKRNQEDLVSFDDDFFALTILVIDVLAGKELWHGKSNTAIIEILSGNSKTLEQMMFVHLKQAPFQLGMLEKFLVGGLRCDSGFLIGLIALLENAFEVMAHVLKE